MGAVAPLAVAPRPVVTTSTAVQGHPALRTTFVALTPCLISDDAIREASAFTATPHSFHNYEAANCYHYLYTGDAGNCHDGGGRQTSGTSACDIRTRAL